jgi:hypothetical protein
MLEEERNVIFARVGGGDGVDGLHNGRNVRVWLGRNLGSGGWRVGC